jgi:hypothetical protein
MTTAPFREAWTAPPTPPPSEADRSAVEACVRDYYESWFEADGERMARALHAALVKRCFGQGPDRAPVLLEDTRDEMVEAAAAGRGVPRRGSRLEIRVCDLGGGIASAVAYADHYVDYLHLIETPDGWKIVNAVWRWADGHGPRA